jgi:cytochrome c peroxidase
LDPLLASPIGLRQDEFAQLVAFVREGLLDARAAPKSLCSVIPVSVPSGRRLLDFQGCGNNAQDRRSGSPGL